jgi:hypothetical protein
MASKTFQCPVCGEDVPAKAKSCPHCGACEKSGWGDTSADGLDLPEDDFDYEKFTGEEFGTERKVKGKRFPLKVAGVVLIVLALIGYIISFTIF